MQDRFDRLEKKIDKITERLGSIDLTLAAQHVSLKEHIRRTEVLEGQVKPIEKHVQQVSGVFKLLGVVATIGGILEGVSVFLQYMKG